MPRSIGFNRDRYSVEVRPSRSNQSIKAEVVAPGFKSVAA